MTARTLSLLAAAAFACATARASESMPAATAPAVGHLTCGDASLTASTTLLDVPNQPRQVVMQTINLVSPGSKTPTALKLDARPLRQPFLRGTPVLDASVTGWACVTSADHKSYVYVAMTCTESPLRPACAGPTREWTRLYDIRGRALDAGYPRDSGPREQALARRLKLDLDSVSMSDPLE